MLAGAALAALRERDEGGVEADVRVRCGAAHDATSRRSASRRAQTSHAHSAQVA
jgi:hypothetical protein